MKGNIAGAREPGMATIPSNKISKTCLLIAAALALPRVVADDSFSSGGCYKQSSISSLVDFSDAYQYQSTSHCEQQCSGKKVAALLNGGNCYCGDTAPDTGDQVDAKTFCNSKCFGYGLDTCGGNGYFQVYLNAAVAGETMSSSASSVNPKSTSSSSSSASSSSSSSSSSSTRTSSSSSSSHSSSSSSSSSSSTVSAVSSVTSQSGNSDSSKTKTVDPSETSANSSTRSSTASETSSKSSSSNSSSSSASSAPPSSSKSLSTGGIVGAAIGSVAGVALIAALIFFLIYRRRKQEDDDEEEYDDKFILSGPAAPNPMDPNPFLIASGYNNFDTSQPQQDPSRTPSGLNISGNQLPYPTSYYHQTQNSDSSNSYGHHSRTNSQGFSLPINGGQQPNGNPPTTEHSYHSSGDKDFMFEQPANNQNGPNDRAPTPEFGRRKLSNGSLPDMIARQPGSLKVVNN